MEYPKCPTCRTILNNKIKPYENGMIKICNSKTLSQEDKDKKKMLLLDELQLIRPCCRQRMMTYTNLVNILADEDDLS